LKFFPELLQLLDLAIDPLDLAPHLDGARQARLAELRRQLSELNAKGRATASNSPERDAVLEEWAPIHAAVLALQDELDDEGG
jgi:hypothetical protein